MEDQLYKAERNLYINQQKIIIHYAVTTDPVLVVPSHRADNMVFSRPRIEKSMTDTWGVPRPHRVEHMYPPRGCARAVPITSGHTNPLPLSSYISLSTVKVIASQEGSICPRFLFGFRQEEHRFACFFRERKDTSLRCISICSSRFLSN